MAQVRKKSVQLEADAEPKDSLNSMETWLKSGSVQLEQTLNKYKYIPAVLAQQ
jgi:C4-dicarboxylate-specific signal transduction histidine kinase